MRLDFGRNQRGQGLMELALFLPFIIAITYLAFECGFYFLTDQRITTLSRDSAFRAFRYCHSDAAGLDSAAMQSCLSTNQVLEQTAASAGRVFGNFDTHGTVVISVYKWVAGVPTQLACYEADTEATVVACGGSTSRFTTASFSLSGGANLVEDLTLIFVGEVIYERTTVFGTSFGTIFPTPSYDYAVF